MRGFLLTSERPCLKPYEEGLRNPPEDLADVRRRSPVDPATMEQVHRLEDLVDARLEVLDAMQDPGANPVALEATSETTPGGLVEVSGAGLEHMYLYGDEVPLPATGNAFQMWLGSGGTFTPVGEPFVPVGGVVLLRLTVDPSRYDEILITEEPLGTTPSAPTPEGGHTWHASI